MKYKKWSLEEKLEILSFSAQQVQNEKVKNNLI
jgi:hypothetical protein